MAKRKMTAPLLQISVTTTAEAEEAVAELLHRLFGSPASVYFNERTKVSRVSVYCEKTPDWSPARRAAITAGLREIRACGVNAGSGKMTQKRLGRENWAESWKRHFKPIAIGSALLLKPSWVKRRARVGQKVVVLDPGLSFGTGHHATTSFCLAQLVKNRSGFRVSGFESTKSPRPSNSKLKTQNSKLSLLDIGTGSGILAIAAAKLGYARIEAFDFDPEAVRVAKENARKNRVADKLRLFHADLTKLPLRSARKFDFVAANLISPLLVAERRRIVNRLKPGGVLALAGILRREFAGVQKAYEAMGLEFVTGRNEKEWRSGAFHFAEKV